MNHHIRNNIQVSLLNAGLNFRNPLFAYVLLNWGLRFLHLNQSDHFLLWSIRALADTLETSSATELPNI